MSHYLRTNEASFTSMECVHMCVVPSLLKMHWERNRSIVGTGHMRWHIRLPQEWEASGWHTSNSEIALFVNGSFTCLHWLNRGFGTFTVTSALQHGWPKVKDNPSQMRTRGPLVGLNWPQATRNWSSSLHGHGIVSRIYTSSTGDLAPSWWQVAPWLLANTVCCQHLVWSQ